MKVTYLSNLQKKKNIFNEYTSDIFQIYKTLLINKKIVSYLIILNIIFLVQNKIVD